MWSEVVEEIGSGDGATGVGSGGGAAGTGGGAAGTGGGAAGAGTGTGKVVAAGKVDKFKLELDRYLEVMEVEGYWDVDMTFW